MTHKLQNTPFEKLSARELQIASLITKGVAVYEIAERFRISPKSVHSYRYRIFEKLNITGNPELMRLAKNIHEEIKRREIK